MSPSASTSIADRLLGHRALRLLLVLKLKAGIRRQTRRLRRPTGWIFAILGLLLVLSWLSSFFIPTAVPFSGEHVFLWTQIGLFVACLMTVLSSFNHRGLYLPREEIELCFSAPLARSDLVRYRLLVNLLRSLFAGVLFGLMTARRMPRSTYSFIGVVLALLSLPILGQATALLLGDAENRLAKVMRKLPMRVISGVIGGLFGLIVMLMFFGGSNFDFGRFESLLSVEQVLRALTHSPWMRTLLLPFEPWARMITAREPHVFTLWFLFCLATWWVAFELTARIPVDFRELSLATSADVARRLNRLRRGGFGASAGDISKQAIGWRVPWIFGRGRFGAIAWLKLAAIVRKARGTLIVSTLIVAFLTLIVTVSVTGSSTAAILGGAALLAGAGTLYLCSGLRFDFRQDLEQMELVKAWPLRPSLIFLATLLPELVLVSAALCLGILVRAGATRQFHPLLFAIIALQPLVTLAWISLDNAVFLFAPVRYTPGDEGALQHMGRSLVLLLLRLLLFTTAGVCAGVPAYLVYLMFDSWLAVSMTASMFAAAATAWCALLGVDLALVWSGGILLRRFDIARDRG